MADKVTIAHFKVNRYSIISQCFELLGTKRRPEDPDVDWETVIDEAILMLNQSLKEYLEDLNRESLPDLSDEAMAIYFALRDAKHAIIDGTSKAKASLVKTVKEIFESLGIEFQLKVDPLSLSKEQMQYYVTVFPDESHAWRGLISGQKYGF